MEKEIEEKELLPESQAGFRKGRRTINNISILNHIIQREKDKRVYVSFIDLKTAFGNVRREKPWQTLEEKGINKELLEKEVVRGNKAGGASGGKAVGRILD